MRVLLDECVPRKLKYELPGHDVRTVTEMGWVGLTNGLLLQQAAGRFDVLITVDQGFEHQQNLTSTDMGIVVMAAKSNDIDDLRPLMPRVRDALATASPGQLIRVDT